MPADQDTEKLIAEARHEAEHLSADSYIGELFTRLADTLASSAPESNCPACNPSSAGEVGWRPSADEIASVIRTHVFGVEVGGKLVWKTTGAEAAATAILALPSPPDAKPDKGGVGS